jgi:hypothetical protein
MRVINSFPASVFVGMTLSGTSWQAQAVKQFRFACRVVRNSCAKQGDEFESSSFRDGPKDQTRNLEIPGSMLRIAPE